MIIYGIDFSSSPSAIDSMAINAKWIYLATCKLDGNCLTVKSLTKMNGEKADDYTNLVELLNLAGPWVAGIDVPFGMPVECIEYFKWLLAEDTEQIWAQYVDRVRKMKTRKDFKKLIESWRHPSKVNDSGEKERVRKYRLIDNLMNSQSPMNCIRPAVGSMFFNASDILRNLPASIHPVRLKSEENRHIVEAYPRMVVDRLSLSSKMYKDADDLEDVRRQILACLFDESKGSSIQDWYGLSVAMEDNTAAECVADKAGDMIDSVLCAVQAAWASRQERFGIPRFNSNALNSVIALEGWVPDPFLAKWRAET